MISWKKEIYIFEVWESVFANYPNHYFLGENDS
jgi:hypothetical protein